MTEGISKHGKRRKTFLDEHDTVELAASIADLQEQKSKTLIARHHPEKVAVEKFDTGLKGKSSRIKLKETKALIAAQKAQAKKDRKKNRPKTISKPEQPVEKVPTKRRVTFA